METLGEFGVFFTLFLVGLEFSPERLRKVFLYNTSVFKLLLLFNALERTECIIYLVSPGKNFAIPLDFSKTI